jgi:YD repeat-containing protein
MVRPIRPNEKDESSFRYGDLDAIGGAGFVGGSSGGVSTGGGKFTGDGQGTGFVNARDYLGANMGKGSAMGEDVTSDAQASIDGITKGNEEMKGLKVDPFAPPLGGQNPLPDKIINKRPTTKDIISRNGGPAGDSINPSSSWETEVPGLADEYDRIAGEYAGRPNKYKGPKSSDINQKYDALSKLSTDGLKLKNVYDPSSPGARDLRANRLDDSANKKGISYGSGSRSFDAMLMEAESPDIFQRKYDALGRALDDFEGMDEVRDEKTAAADKAAADAESYDATEEAKARAAAARERQKNDGSAEAGQAGTFAGTVSGTSKVSAGDDPGNMPGSTKTTNPDGSYQVQTKVNQRDVTMRYDASGRLIEILDSNGNPIKDGGGIFD